MHKSPSPFISQLSFRHSHFSISLSASSRSFGSSIAEAV
jgi:hypothetical protein